MRPSGGLGASEVITLASKIEQDDEAFIIGGQATNLWAWFYRDRHSALPRPLTSSDIVYFGSVESARRFADAVGGILLLPEKGRHTPSAAIVKAYINGREITIDFLQDVLGVTDAELRRGGVSQIALAGKTEDGQDVTSDTTNASCYLFEK